MTNKKTALGIALFAGAFVPAHDNAPVLPLPGPGGVASAVQAFLRHQDAGTDAAGLLADREHAVDFVVDAEGTLAVVEHAPKVPAFCDVDCEGRAVAAPRGAAFAKLLLADIGKNKAADRSLRTELHAIRANCDSERCSLAIVEFDRFYSIGGGKEMRRPMRATALLEWVGGEGASFRIFHWHASPAGEIGR